MGQEDMESKRVPEHDQETVSFNLGQRLKDTRELATMSIEDVADQLRISAKIIKDIEVNDFQTKDMSVYTRGYIRNYARLLNIPELEINLVFDQMGVEKIQKIDQHIKYKYKKLSARDKPIRFLTYIIILILIILVLIWRYSHRQNDVNLIVEPDQLMEKTQIDAQSEAQTTTVPMDTSKLIEEKKAIVSSVPKKQRALQTHQDQVNKQNQVAKPVDEQSKQGVAHLWVNPDE